MMRTTLADASGVVHRVAVPDVIHVPADDRMRPITINAACGDGGTLPVMMAKAAQGTDFTTRTVTCPDCLDREPCGDISDDGRICDRARMHRWDGRVKHCEQTTGVKW